MNAIPTWVQLVSIIGAILTALAPVYVMVWRAVNSAGQAAERSRTINDAVNNVHNSPNGKKLIDHVLDITSWCRDQDAAIARHSQHIQQQSSQIERIAATTTRIERDLCQRPMPWDVLPWAPAIHLALFVHRVDGLAPGLYVRLATRRRWACSVK